MSGSDQAGGQDRLRLVLGALLAVAVAVIAWLAIDAVRTHDSLGEARDRLASQAADDEAGKEAVAAAQKVLAQITTYSFKDGEHDFAWVDQLADQELRDKLAPNVGALQKAIVDDKVSAKGQVLESASRVVSADQVEVLAFVDQAITGENAEGVKIDEQRVSMTMKRVGGEWLVSRLELRSGTNAELAPGAAAPAPEGTTP